MHPYTYTPDDINATLFQELRLETHPDILCEAETITNLALHTFRRVQPLPVSLCVSVRTYGVHVWRGGGVVIVSGCG
jgi:hypothetical protein